MESSVILLGLLVLVCSWTPHGLCAEGDQNVNQKTETDSSAPIPQNYKEVCSLAPETGLCRAYMPTYFYNTTSGQCEIFIYGGCQGNANKFKSLTMCQVYCRAAPQLNSTEVCQLPPETGPCHAGIHKLYYNPERKRCEPFIYGGCQGNSNNFDSAEACQHLCNQEDRDEATATSRRRRSYDGTSVLQKQLFHMFR